MAKFKFRVPDAQFTVEDRLRFVCLLVSDYGLTITEAIAKAELTLAECIYCHDALLPKDKRLSIVENGNPAKYQKIIENSGKRYRYEGCGIFRRVDRLDRPCVDGKSTEIEGATRIGFKANPLYYVF